MSRRCIDLVLALGLIVVVGPGCDELPPVRVLAPLPSSAVTWMPLDLAIDFTSSADTGTLQVLVNGIDVTSSLVIGAPAGGRIAATASRLWQPGLWLPGTNVIEASVRAPGGPLWSVIASVEALGDPYADAVVSTSIGSGGGYGQSGLPAVVTGPPSGAGLFVGSTASVLSLGLGGSIVVQFTDNVIRNGPGVDFTVFENAFLRIASGFVTGTPFVDPGRVSVSQDGVVWHTLPCTLDPGAGPYWPGCAGVYPVLANANDPAAPHASIPSTTPIADLVGLDAETLAPPAGSGGDSFDLATVGLGWARYVKIEAASFVPGPAGAGNAGFDLDAVAATSSVPATDGNGNGVPDALE